VRLVVAFVALAGSALLANAVDAAPHARQAYAFREIADGFTRPVYVATAPGDPATLYVVEQRGTIRIVRGGRIAGTFLDLSDKVLSEGEHGLLGLAFHPDYARNHRLYVDYTDLRGDTHVAELTAEDGVAVPATERTLLFVKQPFPNHKGGQLAFDRGSLYVGLGDGGTDPNASHGDEAGRAQDPTVQLGKILRIDPAAADGTWQLVALGLRNPWRFSFDRRTHDLWIGDVGTHLWEEIDFVAAARVGTVTNFGWSRWEGREIYNPAIPRPSLGTLVFPLYAYRYSSRSCGVIGGYVYRGRRVAAARGRYVFGDLCSGRVSTLVRDTRGRATGVRQDAGTVSGLSSFGESASGELYAVGLGGSLFQLLPVRR
jgi:glucose/arabinose dehydrogenase